MGELADIGQRALVLLALADACSRDDGTGCWPSAATIARKANISDRTVRRVISRLRPTATWWSTVVDVERGWRDMKLCWLALLLIRVARIRRHRGNISCGTLAGLSQGYPSLSID